MGSCVSANDTDIVINEPYMNDNTSNESGIIIHSPILNIGKQIMYTTRIVPNYGDWKAKMQVYLEELFAQLYSYDVASLKYVVYKYVATLNGTGMPYRTSSPSARFINARNEIKLLFEQDGPLDIEYLAMAKVYTDTLLLLDTYAKNKLLEDFEEIVFVLTIIINYPNLLKAETRW
jgi:hypothetical protein